MPLKPDDLKSIDAYKKAIKMDASKISTSGGTKFWLYKDVELPSKQKLPMLLTLIDDVAVKALVKGKPPVCRGTCGIKNSQIVLEASQGAVPYELLKVSIPAWTGKVLHNSALDEEKAAVPPPAPPHPPAPGSAPGPNKPGSATPYPGLVKYRAALVQFAQAKSQVKAQIGGLRNAIAAQAPGEKDFANALAKELEELNDELAGVVDEAMKGAENEASPATEAIKQKIRKYQSELASNHVVAQADSNPLGVSVTIAKTLGEALSRIRESMPA